MLSRFQRVHTLARRAANALHENTTTSSQLNLPHNKNACGYRDGGSEHDVSGSRGPRDPRSLIEELPTPIEEHMSASGKTLPSFREEDEERVQGINTDMSVVAYMVKLFLAKNGFKRALKAFEEEAISHLVHTEKINNDVDLVEFVREYELLRSIELKRRNQCAKDPLFADINYVLDVHMGVVDPPIAQDSENEEAGEQVAESVKVGDKEMTKEEMMDIMKSSKKERKRKSKH